MRSGGGRLTLLFVILLMLTAGLPQVRFTFGDEELLPNLDFRTGTEGWAISPGQSDVSTGDGALSLAQPDTSDFIAVSQRLADVQRFDFLRLSGEIMADGIVQGELFWQVGRVVLVGRDADGRAMIRRSHVLAAQKGSGGWAAHQAVFQIAPGMVEMQLSVELPKAAGRFSVRNLSLRAAEQAAWFPIAGILLIVGWVGAAVWASRRLLARKSGVDWRQPVLACLLLLSFVQVVPELRASRFEPLFGVGFVDISGGVMPMAAPAPILAPVPQIEEIISLLPTLMKRASNGGARLRETVTHIQFRLQRLDLLAHFVGFMALTLVCAWLSGARPRRVMPYLFAAAIAGEVGQWSVQGQVSGTDFVEIGVDFAGAVFLSLVLWRYNQRE
ncbi:MAG: hypothetical protein ACTSX7_10030 [Alphaproteobacteria bacterium]